MQGGRKRKLIKAVSAAAAAALLAVPVAQGRVDIGTQQAAAKDTRPIVRTDARHAALLNGKKVKVEIVRAQPSIPTAQSRSTSVSSGIDWTLAGIGGASLLGLALVAGGAFVTRRRLAGV